MEIHAHHLHKLPGKNFWHYFFEFFMLFLAITAGFFTENLREQRNERAEGLEYIKSFVNDLKKDTSTYSNIISIYQEKKVALDELYRCHDSVMMNLPCDCLGDLYTHSTGFPDLINANGTLQQLKSTGLRVINHDDADSILEYDEHFRMLQLNETTTIQETQTLIRNIGYELFDFRIHDPRNALDGKKTAALKILFSNNKPLLNKYFSALNRYRSICNDQIADIGDLREHAIVLINYFRNKYHLE